ncbi:MAG TPA: hypothetical protein VHG88_01965 [Burkholderiales bacterium]|nr:hypothetical protein [Burkholderiales bacterium]
MAEYGEAHGAQHPLALVPEQLLPAKAAHHLDQVRLRARHDHAALVQQCEQVALASAPPALTRNRSGVQSVEPRLGARKGQPRERVEQVVAACSAGEDAAGLEYVYLVIRVRRLRRHEAHRPPAFGAQARLLGERVQALQRRGAELFQPRAHRVVYRMR